MMSFSPKVVLSPLVLTAHLLLLTGCNHIISFVEGSNHVVAIQRGQLIGSWGYVLSSGAASAFGFKLKEDGTAESVNTQLPDVGCWQLRGNQLILSARGHIEQGCDLLRADTFKLEIAGNGHLKLSKDDLLFEFVKQ